MIRHTPGPWAAKRAVKPSDGGYDFGIFTADDDLIAETYEVIDDSARRMPVRANARLIAEAPALLDAAELALEALDNLTTEQFSLGYDKGARELLRAVIARARA